MTTDAIKTMSVVPPEFILAMLKAVDSEAGLPPDVASSLALTLESELVYVLKTSALHQGSTHLSSPIGPLSVRFPPIYKKSAASSSPSLICKPQRPSNPFLRASVNMVTLKNLFPSPATSGASENGTASLTIACRTLSFTDAPRRVAVCDTRMATLSRLGTVSVSVLLDDEKKEKKEEDMSAAETRVTDLGHEVLCESTLPSFVPTTALAFPPADASFLLTGGEKGSLQLWHVPSKHRVVSYALEHTAAVMDLAFHPCGGHFFVSGSLDGTARLWRTDLLQSIRHFLHPSGSTVTRVCFHPSGFLVATAFTTSVALWDVTTGKNLLGHEQFLRGHTGDITCLAFSPDGHLLASADAIGHVILWDLVNGLTVAEAKGTEVLSPLAAQPVTGLAFTSDSSQLVSAQSDGRVQRWYTSVPVARLRALAADTEVLARKRKRQQELSDCGVVIVEPPAPASACASSSMSLSGRALAQLDHSKPCFIPQATYMLKNVHLVATQAAHSIITLYGIDTLSE